MTNNSHTSTSSMFPAPKWPLPCSMYPSSDGGGDISDTDSVDSDSLQMFSPGPSDDTAMTSYTISRSVSPTPSVWSLTSSLREQSFKQEYGRGLNNYSEVYRLPADEEEIERLHKQHLLFQSLMGKYPPPLPAALAHDGTWEVKAVLDLGCGSGSWIMEVAREFPHCSAVAVDLVPMQSVTMPSNCRSEVDDINLGLEHFYGDFNVVHAQLISAGIKNYFGLIDQISKVLRPGGLVQIVEFDFCAYDENHQRIEADTSTIAAPWWPRWLAFVRTAARNAGADLTAASNLKDWISNNPVFQDVVYTDYWCPSCAWDSSSDLQLRNGAAMRDDILRFLKSGRPLLLGSGVPEELVATLEQNASQELRDAVLPSYIRMQSIYAHKRKLRP